MTSFIFIFNDLIIIATKTDSLLTYIGLRNYIKDLNRFSTQMYNAITYSIDSGWELQ